MRYLRNNYTDPYYNMAFDEYVLERLPLEEPHFYLWQNRPAVIIGLNQDALAEVNVDYLRENGIALVRRVTGGGAVYHDLGNLNYTIVGRSADLNRDYPEYTRYMLQALQALGVEAELSGRNDILVDGRKVSGYAKRVYKDRLMVHGTLMYDVDLAVLERALDPSDDKLVRKGIASVRSRVANLCEYLPEVSGIDDFRMRLEQYLSANYHDDEVLLSEEQHREVSRLAHEKFETEGWTYKRSLRGVEDKTLIIRKGRFACGTVMVELRVINGRVVSCHLNGDFIGNLSPGLLEEALVGVNYGYDTLLECFRTIDVGCFLDGVQPEELARLIIGDGVVGM